MVQMLKAKLEWMDKNSHDWSYEAEKNRLIVRERDSLITGAFLDSVIDVAKGFGLSIYITSCIDNRMEIVIS